MMSFVHFVDIQSPVVSLKCMYVYVSITLLVSGIE